MKPLISYYGGKQRMANKIVPLIPKHTVYVEPFAGGAAIMFAKPWPKVSDNNHYREVMNDVDGDLINFYRQLRDDGEELVRRLQLTPYSREEYVVSKSFDCDDLERARRYYVNIQQSFSNKLNHGWGFNKKTHNSAFTWFSKVQRLDEYLRRMSGVFLDNIDVIDCIKRWDSPQTFFYCDPPYVGTDCGSYQFFSLFHLQRLVDLLDNIKGSFIMSGYESKAEIPVGWEKFKLGKTGGMHVTKTRDVDRTEIVYRKFSKHPVSSDIRKLYDSGKYDCFTGGRHEG